jgi:cobalt/nickel transport system permease protein
MAFPHVLIAGPIEGVITALVTSHLLRTNPTLFQTPGFGSSSPQSIRKSPLKKNILTMSLLVLLTPLGLLASGTAWGEWGTEDINSQLGFIPAGMEKASSFWQHSILSDYAVSGLEDAFWQQALGYLLSAFVGLGVITLIGFTLYKIFLRAEGSHESTPLASRKPESNT